MSEDALKQLAEKALTDASILKELQDAWQAGGVSVSDNQLAGASAGSTGETPNPFELPDAGGATSPSPDQVSSLADAIAAAMNSGNDAIAGIVKRYS